MSSDRQRPLARVSSIVMVYSIDGSIAQLTDIQFVARYCFISIVTSYSHVEGSPIIINGLDNKTQRRTDTVHILIHNLLDNSGLACIVQSPTVNHCLINHLWTCFRLRLFWECQDAPAPGSFVVCQNPKASLLLMEGWTCLQ